MYRTTILAAIALGSVMVASAGQIQIGGVNGLSTAYITAPNTVAGQNTTGCAGGGTCVAGSVGAYTEQNYDNVLFAGATNGGTPPTPYGTYNQTTAEQGSLTDPTSNIKFSMIDDGTSSGASNNFWQGTQAGCTPCSSPQITIPIGIFGVTDVWALLNTELSAADVTNTTTLTFTFGSQRTGGTTQNVIVKLSTSNNNNTPANAMQNAVLCVPASNCTTASGPTLGESVISSVTVLTDNVYTSLYNNGALAGYAGATTGNVVLDDSGFIFNGISLATIGGTNLTNYLQSVSVKESGATNGVSEALSAITVDTVPEPSTVFMFLSGLGAIGLARFRRRK
jgi:hypothetical protein